MSGWQAGDLALCVKTTQWHGTKTGNPIDGPPHNSIHKVIAIGSHEGGMTIAFAEFAGNPEPFRYYLADRFRKIKPDTEGANEDDAAWLKDLLTKKVKA